MYVREDDIEERAGNIPRRVVKGLDLFEVSLIDDRLSPCYAGTSIEHRAEGEAVEERRGDEFRAVTIDAAAAGAAAPDYSAYEEKLKKIKGAV